VKHKKLAGYNSTLCPYLKRIKSKGLITSDLLQIVTCLQLKRTGDIFDKHYNGVVFS